MNNLGENQIHFHGIRTHNLKNISISLPKNQIITITGVSGSGKSSLAFDTIYKEGQYRYIESLSSYLRQFFNLGARPEIDYSSGLSPAIAIEQNKRVGNSRSTIGTLTEIDDYLRLLFAKLGEIYCYKCGQKIKPDNTDSIIGVIKDKFLDQKIYILEEANKYADYDEFQKFIRKNRRKVEIGEGFVRYLIFLNQLNSKFQNYLEYFYLEDPNIPAEFFPIQLFGIYDRVSIEESRLARLREDIIRILSKSKKFGVFLLNDQYPEFTASDKKNFLEIQNNQIFWFTDKNFCPNCNIEYPEFTTQNFSPNRQEGACVHCHGLGETLQVDYDKIIDPFSSYLKAILPWRDSNLGQNILEKLADKYSIDVDKNWKDQATWVKDLVLQGDAQLMRIQMGGKYMSIYYRGIEDVLTQQYHKGLLTVDFQNMLEIRVCPDCNGAKIKKESLHVLLNSGKNITKNIFELQQLSMQNLNKFFLDYLKSTNKPIELVEKILNPLLDRITTIANLGLDYLTVNRSIDSLSGGEIQRLRLAKQLGNKLAGIIYVLDEPTIGLDNQEIKKIILAVQKLKEIGNTIIVVEHNEEFIKKSDWIVEIGPGAGDFGGEIVFAGPYRQFLKTNTLTAQYINKLKTFQVIFEHKPANFFLRVNKATKHNLQNIDISIQLGTFTVLTGPSGAGKTTLMYHILYKFLAEKEKYIQGYIRLSLLKKGYSWTDIIGASMIKREEYENLENLAIQKFYLDLGVESIKGYEQIKNIIYVDQISIGKTPRSCPATFIGLFDDIRNLFASVNESKMIGFSAGNFSFNSAKGACPECEGHGYKKVELQFLPDTYVPCQLCKGKRYKPEILTIKWRGKNISEVLNMYIQDAQNLFVDIPYVEDKINLLVDIGLGYLKLGQPAHTLSGGESQRLKLVKHLLKSYKGHTIYFLDEPTVGLHTSDIEKLLRVLAKFLNKGDTILMIEHEKNILQYADQVITLQNGKIKNN